MPFYWNNQRQTGSCVVLALCAFATVASCALEESPSQKEEPSVASKKRRSSSDDDDALDGGARTSTSTRAKQRDASSDARDAGEPEPTKKKTKKADAAAKAEEPEKGEKSAPDAGDSPDDSPDDDEPASGMEPPKDEGDAECSRTWLREKADEYLESMASSETMSLRTHASFRYTENGQEQQLGAGVWLRQADVEFSRHVLDETHCSSFIQAVMEGLTGRFSFGVRLRYAEGELLEAEAQFAPELVASTDLDAIIPTDEEDPFVAEVPMDERMSREELFDYAHSYFDSVTGISSLPPSAPDCHRLQNGRPLGDGTCTEPPGTMRFEQQRFDLADEPAGIVTASVLYNGHIGFYLLKISDKMLQDIQVIGGATSQATGW